MKLNDTLQNKSSQGKRRFHFMRKQFNHSKGKEYFSWLALTSDGKSEQRLQHDKGQTSPC